MQQLNTTYGPVTQQSIKEGSISREEIEAKLKAGPLRMDAGKTRYDLLPPDALEEIAKVFTVGAKKYSDNNWQRGMNYSRFFSAAMRHLWKWWAGQDKDEETGYSHMAHAAFNVMALLAHELRGMTLFDDRPNMIHMMKPKKLAAYEPDEDDGEIN